NIRQCEAFLNPHQSMEQSPSAEMQSKYNGHPVLSLEEAQVHTSSAAHFIFLLACACCPEMILFPVHLNSS
ncbi:hypothetical protein KVQ90_24585, partial [Escherichia coli]|nr:hypothetical protein [Escherichia coli]